MNTLRKNVLVALAALSLGGAAFAADVPAQAPQQQQQHQHPHLTKEQRQAKMAEFFARREAKLHDALKITPAQEPAFNAFVASMKPAAHGDRAQWANLSAPERMQKHIAMMQARLDALNTFYSTLSPEQKKLMDQHAMHRFGGHGEHRWHGGMQHGEHAQG